MAGKKLLSIKPNLRSVSPAVTPTTPLRQSFLDDVSVQARTLMRLVRDIEHGDPHTAALAALLLRALNKDPKLAAAFRKKPGKSPDVARTLRIAQRVTQLRTLGQKQHQAITRVAEEEFGPTDTGFEVVEKIYKLSLSKTPILHVLIGNYLNPRRPRR